MSVIAAHFVHYTCHYAGCTQLTLHLLMMYPHPLHCLTHYSLGNCVRCGWPLMYPPPGHLLLIPVRRYALKWVTLDTCVQWSALRRSDVAAEMLDALQVVHRQKFFMTPYKLTPWLWDKNMSKSFRLIRQHIRQIYSEFLNPSLKRHRNWARTRNTANSDTLPSGSSKQKILK